MSVIGVPDIPGIAFKIFSVLGGKGINVDIIIQSVSRDDRRDISFTIPEEDEEDALAALRDNAAVFGFTDILIDRDVAKVSIVGAGMLSHSGIASRMFGAIFDSDINLKWITTSEIKISVIVQKRDADRAVEAVHREFVKHEQ